MDSINRHILIAGPCAAESEAQVLETARALKAQAGQVGQLIFRAGLWKPRSSPDTFQGVGDAGLAWLRRVQRETCLKVATEVSTAEQAEAALAAGVNYLWIGARTAANPIQVQLLADTIRNRAEGVWVKNPVSEDAALWIGNICRFRHYTPDVWAIHRGCNHQPCWAMARQLREALPEIRLLLDPSHMSGAAEQVGELMLQTAHLPYDGYMVETHPHPAEALSDARQQITPEVLSTILTQMTVLPEDTTEATLQWYRAEMDEVDDRLWDTLAQRMQISRRIGEWKKTQGMAAVQPKRKAEILNRRLRWAEQAGLTADTVRNIWEAIHAESVKSQVSS
jgi:chorismate mutase